MLVVEKSVGRQHDPLAAVRKNCHGGEVLGKIPDLSIRPARTARHLNFYMVE